MSDRMTPLAFPQMLRWIVNEDKERGSIFGIDRALRFRPRPDDPFAHEDGFGHRLATPVGPAAGPHTQLAQNIVAAWLCGGRFIELKTVQIMDTLEIPRPCIDLADEGYNVEWSQELPLAASRAEYVKAWVLIHLLREHLGMNDAPLGTVFNMSVGYNLEGITSGPMTAFMNGLENAEAEIGELLEVVARELPEQRGLRVPSRIVDGVTLSTMHGCPPDEIERIAAYLLTERRLHTTVKLNPTLLGRDEVLHILNDVLGYKAIRIPERVFDDDLQYDQAVELIDTLRGVARREGLGFSVKLSNTLAMENHRGVLPGDEMYMSGRALYPVTMQLFRRLHRRFEGDLPVSFCAGVDALNLPEVLACGAWPVTVASDLLKPGGYGRLRQYMERLGEAMTARGVRSLAALAADPRGALDRAAASALSEPRYRQSYHGAALPKVESALEAFDCICAPCVAQCAVCQDVPDYARALAAGRPDDALAVILARNPLPGVTGRVCPHRCEERCTRIDYDEPVAIRDLKRFAVEAGAVELSRGEPTGHRVAVVGSGPSGLSAAYFLARSGVGVTIFESQSAPGGMLALAPGFRLPREVVDRDIRRILDLGVELRVDAPIRSLDDPRLAEGFDAVYLGCGFPKDARLDIEGEDARGVLHALGFLRDVANDRAPKLEGEIVVIGGGNTAMDAARTAARLAGRPVTVLYRRTREEMPCEPEELDDLLEEGNRLTELVSPTRFVTDAGSLAAITLTRNRLGAADEGGRRRPEPVAGSAFDLETGTAIVAVGQAPDRTFLQGAAIDSERGGALCVDPATGCAGGRVYAGGDATRGPATIIEACADGRRAAEAICARLGLELDVGAADAIAEDDVPRLKRRRANRAERAHPERTPPEQRGGFEAIDAALDPAAARREAERCLQCATLCDKCVEVCPNRANVSYRVTPRSVELPRYRVEDGELVIAGRETFEVAQERQIVHIEELCNACGNCATFCVRSGKPFEDKPILCLTRAAFDGLSGERFYACSEGLVRRRDGVEAVLSVTESGWLYDDGAVRVCLGRDLSIERAELLRPFAGERSLSDAAKTVVLYDGLIRSAGHLLALEAEDEGGEGRG